MHTMGETVCCMAAGESTTRRGQYNRQTASKPLHATPSKRARMNGRHLSLSKANHLGEQTAMRRKAHKQALKSPLAMIHIAATRPQEAALQPFWWWWVSCAAF